jgi:hypothetical protein
MGVAGRMPPGGETVPEPTTQHDQAGRDVPDSANDAAPGPARFGPWRSEIRALLELLALTGIALTRPALDILRRNPAIFVTQGTSKTQLIALTLGLVLVAPALLWGAEVVAGLAFPPSRRFVHLALIGFVVAVIGVEVLKKQTSLAPAALVGGGLLVGALGAFFVVRFAAVRMWLHYLAIAPAIFAVLFLLSKPVATAVFDPSPVAVAGVKVGNPKRVVMMVMDEFPTQSLLDGTGHIDETLFPNFAAFARDSTWYRNDTTVAPYTEQAAPAILTGDLPQDPSVVPVASSYPKSIFTLLGGKYRMNVQERITRLCPASLCPESQRDRARTSGGLRRLTRETLDLWADDASPDRQPAQINLGKIGEPNLRAFATGRQFVQSLQPTNRPQLDLLHIFLPHQAWHYIGTGQDYLQTAVAPGLPFYAWTTPWAAMSGKQRHLVQLQAADTLLGQIIGKLKQIGAYDDSLVVLTADHGVAFRVNDSFRGVSAKNYAQIMWTPLFIKGPGQVAGVVDDRPVRSVDVLPTIAAHLDTKIPWKVDGRSVLGPPKPDGPREVFEWDLNILKPPAGQKYIKVDGPKGFASVLAGRAWDASGDPRLRLYRIGKYGSLVGQRAAPLAVARQGPSGSLEHPEFLKNVRVGSKQVPWLYVSGRIATPKAGEAIAVAVNGVVAGLAETDAEPGVTESTRFWGLLAPEAFHDGTNSVDLYLVDGPAGAPRLTPVRRTR